MDPVVLTAYRHYHMQAVLHNRRSYDPDLRIRQTTWKEVHEANSSMAPSVAAAGHGHGAMSVLCCNKEVDSDRIHWHR